MGKLIITGRRLGEWHARNFDSYLKASFSLETFHPERLDRSSGSEATPIKAVEELCHPPPLSSPGHQVHGCCNTAPAPVLWV